MSFEEAAAGLARLFSGPPQQPGKGLWHHRRYDLVRLEDGSVGFIRNEFDAKLEVVFREVLDELLGRSLRTSEGQAHLPSQRSSSRIMVGCETL
jgi:hypothetical protein